MAVNEQSTNERMSLWALMSFLLHSLSPSPLLFVHLPFIHGEVQNRPDLFFAGRGHHVFQPLTSSMADPSAPPSIPSASSQRLQPSLQNLLLSCCSNPAYSSHSRSKPPPPCGAGSLQLSVAPDVPLLPSADGAFLRKVGGVS